MLGVSEREVIDFAESGVLPAYKVGGVYLRFKRLEVEEYRKKHRPSAHKAAAAHAYPMGERISDFFYFNDFYILAALLVILMAWFIVRG